MAASDWTYWDWIGSGVTIRNNIIRYDGYLWMYGDNRKIRVIDEDVQSGGADIATVPGNSDLPVDQTLTDGWEMWRIGQYLYCACYVTRSGWAPHIVLYRYDTVADDYIKVFDPYDETGYSHSFSAVEGTSIRLNKVGWILPAIGHGGPGAGDPAPIIICSYNGTNWFNGWEDLDADQVSAGSAYATDYAAMTTQSNKWCTTDLNYWSDHSNTEPANTIISRFDNKLWYGPPGEVDQWHYTEDLFGSEVEWRAATPFTTKSLRQVNTGGGLYWTCASYGLAYWITDTNAWQIDYPNFPTANMNIFWLEHGYTGNLFFYSHDYSAGGGRVYKRTGIPGGGLSGLGLGSVKLSIDRDSTAVYCTTYGTDTHATNYWRVESDLSDVTLIEKSQIPEVYGGVHSSQGSGVHCYGNIDGDLVRRSYDSGVTFEQWAVPSGLGPLEASTLYTLRDTNLPDNVVVTITLSGGGNDSVYQYDSTWSGGIGGGWSYQSTASFTAESQARRSIRTFIGALEPSSGTVVDYSEDEGLTWTPRDTPLPIITITDLEFA